MYLQSHQEMNMDVSYETHDQHENMVLFPFYHDTSTFEMISLWQPKNQDLELTM